MSNDLVPAGGSTSLVVPSGDGPVTATDVGAVSIDRAAPARQSEAAADIQRINGELLQALEREAGLSADQIVRGRAVFQRFAGRFHEAGDAALIEQQLTDDQRDKAECLAQLGGAFTWEDRELLRREVPDELKQARTESGRCVFNTASVVNWFLALLKPQPRGTRSSPAPDPRPGRLREIAGWMGAAPGSADYRKYWDDPKVQSEYQQLLGAGVTRDQPATAGDWPRVSAEIDPELREIRELMRKPGSRYWVGADADRLQRRYRELLDELRDAGV